MIELNADIELDDEYLGQLGKTAYDAYCETRNWKSFNGEPLPQWDAVRDDIKHGWKIAAKAVIDIHDSI